ncbi:hypothetical protein CHISP_0376 [Chitinispirillum alkaliphilum]|nr:hypothetical protein CHISP_0376 [Chitinispirillum alkaliphilum]
MVNSSTSDYNRYNVRDTSLLKVFGISVLFHLIVLVVLPLLARHFWKPVEFERPQTFQLVEMPLPPSQPKPVPVEEPVPEEPVPQPEVEPEPKPVPAEEPVPPPPEPEPVEQPRAEEEPAAPVEDLSELESILSELPVPVEVRSSSSDFRHNHYLNLVRQRIERHWTPHRENPNISVVVSFTINQDGSVSDLSISRSSGDSTLDNLALRAVTLASPFSRLPYGLSDGNVELNVTLIPARR